MRARFALSWLFSKCAAEAVVRDGIGAARALRSLWRYEPEWLEVFRGVLDVHVVLPTVRVCARGAGAVKVHAHAGSSLRQTILRCTSTEAPPGAAVCLCVGDLFHKTGIMCDPVIGQLAHFALHHKKI